MYSPYICFQYRLYRRQSHADGARSHRFHILSISESSHHFSQRYQLVLHILVQYQYTEYVLATVSLPTLPVPDIVYRPRTLVAEP